MKFKAKYSGSATDKSGRRFRFATGDILESEAGFDLSIAEPVKEVKAERSLPADGEKAAIKPARGRKKNEDKPND